MKKPKMNLDKESLKQILVIVNKKAAVAARHSYFVFVMLLIAGLGTGVYFITEAFSINDEEYRAKKMQEIISSFRLRKDKETADRVLQRQTADTGPIQPNYDPSRDNPFSEN